MKFENKGFSKGVNDYFNHYIDMADAKAAGVLGVSFVILGFLKDINHSCKFQDFLFYGSGISLILSSIVAIWVVFPRLPKDEKGFIFWENVKQFENRNEFIEQVANLTDDQIEFEYAQQNHIVSKILSTKQYWVRTSIILLILGLVGSSVLYSL